MNLFKTLACGLSLVAAVACGGDGACKKECDGGDCATAPVTPQSIPVLMPTGWTLCALA